MFLLPQSPRNGEDLSDAEVDLETNSNNNIGALQHRDSTSEEGLNSQVRVKVCKSK